MKTLMQRFGTTILVAGLALTPVTAKDMSLSDDIALGGVTIGTALVLYEVYRAQQKVERQEMAPEAFAEKIAYYLKKYPFAFAGLGIATASAATYGVAQILHSNGGGPNQELLKDRFEALNNDLTNTTLATTIADEIKKDIFDHITSTVKSSMQTDPANLGDFFDATGTIRQPTFEEAVKTILRSGGLDDPLISSNFNQPFNILLGALMADVTLKNQLTNFYTKLGPKTALAKTAQTDYDVVLEKTQEALEGVEMAEEVYAAQAETAQQKAATAARDIAGLTDATIRSFGGLHSDYNNAIHSVEYALEQAPKALEKTKQALDAAHDAQARIDQALTSTAGIAAAINGILIKANNAINATKNFVTRIEAAIERIKQASQALKQVSEETGVNNGTDIHLQGVKRTSGNS